MKTIKTISIILLCLIVFGLTALGVEKGLETSNANTATETQAETAEVNTESAQTQTKSGQDETVQGQSETSAADTKSDSSFKGLTTLIDTSSLFTERDLEQTPDTSDAEQLTLTDGQNITISAEGVYYVTGNASNVTIIVEAADSDKVQIVLDNVTITNQSAPAIYVKSADKVFVTSTGDNTLSTTGTFASDGTTNTDAVIFSKSDLVLNGTGSLTISSTANGISGKDDLKITGGTYTITATKDAIEAHDSIRISDGVFKINAGKDAFHSEDDEDDSVGYIYIAGGTFEIKSGDDALQGTTYTIIDGGTFTIASAEAIEGTGVQINGGSISINASDDGINASSKTSQFTPFIEINDGTITIKMGQGDTDAIDSNGNLTINGGTIDITAQFAFDYDGKGSLNGGSVTVNGTKITELTMTGPGGGMGDFRGGGTMDGNMNGPMGGPMGGPGRNY